MSRDARYWRLKAPLALLLAMGLPRPGQAGVFSQSAWSIRIQPSPEYSRIVLEFAEALTYKHFTLKGPERLVLDLEGVLPNGALTDIASRLSPKDPYIASLRVGLNRPNVTRLVIELKTAARAEVFLLKPMGGYAYRLVIDLKGDAQLEPIAPVVSVATPAPIPEARRLVTIAIDAGHGGEDPGAHGARGTLEKNVTLSIARRIRARIEQTDNMRAVMIRDGDYFIPLHERVNKALRAKADIFISIHADAFYKASAKGSSVFILSVKGASSMAARWLAKRENDADLIGGVRIDVKEIYARKSILDMLKDFQIVDSKKLAEHVLDEIGEINDLHKAVVEEASFAVLKAPDIPSILIETAFISNPEEERKLTDESHQERIATAIVAGLSRYLATKPPLSRPDKTARLD